MLTYAPTSKPCQRCGTPIPVEWRGVLCLQCTHPARNGYYRRDQTFYANRCGYNATELHVLARRVDCGKALRRALADYADLVAQA